MSVRAAAALPVEAGPPGLYAGKEKLHIPLDVRDTGLFLLAC